MGVTYLRKFFVQEFNDSFNLCRVSRILLKHSMGVTYLREFFIQEFNGHSEFKDSFNLCKISRILLKHSMGVTYLREFFVQEFNDSFNLCRISSQQPGVLMPQAVRPRRNDKSNSGRGGPSSSNDDTSRNRWYRPY